MWQKYLIRCAKLIFLSRLVDGWVILLTPFNWQSKLNISFIDFFCNMTVFSLPLASCLTAVVVKCKYGFRSCIHPFLTIFFKLSLSVAWIFYKLSFKCCLGVASYMQTLSYWYTFYAHVKASFYLYSIYVI